MQQQEALQNAARPSFAVRTTAVCCGCHRGRTGMTPGIARGFRIGSWRRRGGGGRGRWTGAVDGGGGRGRWTGPRPHQKKRKIQLSQLRRSTPPYTEISAQRTASRVDKRVITASSLVEPPAIPHRARAKTRQTKRLWHKKRGATRRRSCANRHAHTAPMTEDETRTRPGRPIPSSGVP